MKKHFILLGGHSVNSTENLDIEEPSKMVRNVVFEIDDNFGNYTVLYRIKDRFELHRLIDDVYTISFLDANGNKQKEVVMK